MRIPHLRPPDPKTTSCSFTGSVEPATLLGGVGKYLTHRLPEPECPVTDGEHRGLHAAALARTQQVRPGLTGLAVPVIERDELLGAVGAHADHHLQAHLVLLQTDLEMDPVDPHVDVIPDPPSILLSGLSSAVRSWAASSPG